MVIRRVELARRLLQTPGMTSLWLDLHYAPRMMAKRPR
jgi:hypothetical protein